MENSKVVDQREQTINRFFADHEASLRKQGVVVASYRRRGERRLGPYYRLACRVGGRQVSIYLGTDQDLIESVRRRLADLQASLRNRRLADYRRRALRRHARDARRTVDVQLVAIGLRLQGHEIRGWRMLKAIGSPERMTEPKLQLRNGATDG